MTTEHNEMRHSLAGAHPMQTSPLSASNAFERARLRGVAEPTHTVLWLSRVWVSRRTFWWLAQRSHMRRLYGARHVSVLADSWEWLAADITADLEGQMSRLMAIPNHEAAPTTAVEDFATVEARYLRLLRESGFNENHRPLPNGPATR